MSIKLKDIIQESFEAPETMTPDKLKGLIQETLRFFHQVQERLSSKEETIRIEALQEASDLKTLLEDQVARLCSQLGKSPDEILALAQERKRFSEKEWETLNEARADIKQFKQEMSETIPSASGLKIGSKKKKKKNWIAG